MGQVGARLVHDELSCGMHRKRSTFQGPWLKEGKNELIFLEVEKSPSEATGECSLCAWGACTWKAVHALLVACDVTKASRWLDWSPTEAVGRNGTREVPITRTATRAYCLFEPLKLFLLDRKLCLSMPDHSHWHENKSPCRGCYPGV